MLRIWWPTECIFFDHVINSHDQPVLKRIDMLLVPNFVGTLFVDFNETVFCPVSFSW